jgi:membrane protein implicated in regulation of membrane protease activity
MRLKEWMISWFGILTFCIMAMISMKQSLLTPMFLCWVIVFVLFCYYFTKVVEIELKERKKDE